MMLELLALFWVITIFLVAITGMKRMKSARVHRPRVIGVRHLRRGISGPVVDISLFGYDTGIGMTSNEGDKVLRNLKQRYLNLMREAESQDLPQNIKQKIINEFKAKIEEIDKKLGG
jgi:hypothetical protein